MPDDPADDLVIACLAFINAQRTLTARLTEAGTSDAAIQTAMTAGLDQLSVAVRDAQHRALPRHIVRGSEPGE